MRSLKILVVEGNLESENNSFKDAGIETHTESLQNSIANYHNCIEYEIINPSSGKNLEKIARKLDKYDGMVWGGSSLNIYNDTIEIKRQIEFMKKCLKEVKNIFAICWGMQVAVTAAGGAVRKSVNGSHIGIAYGIKINDIGKKYPIYNGKNEIFNSPAFNFDEVYKIPDNATLLASNSINRIQSLNFKIGNTEVWAIQYHP